MQMTNVEEYVNKPYTIEVFRDGPGYVARVLELPGCITQADSFDELEDMVQDAMSVWISTAIEDGETVPEPRNDDQYSGKFLLRVPRTLHRQLAEEAVREGVSLNAYVNVALARSVGV